MQIDGFDWQVYPMGQPHPEDYNGRRYLRRYRGDVWTLSNQFQTGDIWLPAPEKGFPGTRPEPPEAVLDLAKWLRVKRWGRKRRTRLDEKKSC